MLAISMMLLSMRMALNYGPTSGSYTRNAVAIRSKTNNQPGQWTMTSERSTVLLHATLSPDFQ
jgi:hypothetical protein